MDPLVSFFSNSSPDLIIFTLLRDFGWLPIVAVFIAGAKMMWIDYINGQWGGQFKKILLAIDVPRGNEQAIEAVENLLTYFAGAHQSFNLIDTYWTGMYQLSFSFEIVSIDGYTQFIIRTPEQFRGLVESAVYSQYPDAEITEVNDYTTGMPAIFPNDEWDIWGAEFIPVKHWAFPIKTYKEFQTKIGKPEVQFKDPMASFMDLCSSLRTGEQIWYQILVSPEGFDWVKESEAEIKKLLNEKGPAAKNNIADHMVNGMIGLMGYLSEMVFSLWSDVPPSKPEEKKDDALKMMNLKPVEKKKIEAISLKSAKLGFKCKQRFIYIARKDVMNKPKVVNGFVGYMKQFIDMNLNNLKPDMERTATSANYFFRDARINKKKMNLMNGYRNRDGTIGGKKYILNIEELATLWHFPVEAVVKAPLIQKAPGRKSEPPLTLPIADEAVNEELMHQEINWSGEVRNNGKYKKDESNFQRNQTLDLREDNDFEIEEKGSAPSNLPFA